jgi:hypothetical protein
MTARCPFPTEAVVTLRSICHTSTQPARSRRRRSDYVDDGNPDAPDDTDF